MKRSSVTLLLVALLTLVAATASAQRLVRGKSVIWAGLNGNDSQLVGPVTGSLLTFEGDEIGLHLAYSYFVSDPWAAVVSGGFDLGSNSFDPSGSTATLEATSNSWNVRLGFDRYAYINDDVALYAGPGILFWRGHAEFDGSGSPALDRKWPEVQQVAFNGRLGMYARFAPHYALFGHIGQVLGHNHANDGNGKNTWWSNHHEGSVGIAIDL